MINIYNALHDKKVKSKMILQVHDELIFDIHKDEIEIVKQIVGQLMTDAISLKVPVVVDINTGSNWLEAH